MKEKKGKPVYEPPRARDLGDPFVSGGGPAPMGICNPGGDPITNWCADGPHPFQDCYAGSGWTTPCGGGVGPEYGGCQTGGEAIEGCAAGGDPAYQS